VIEQESLWLQLREEVAVGCVLGVSLSWLGGFLGFRPFSSSDFLDFPHPTVEHRLVLVFWIEVWESDV